jgi:hypothetical protein
MGGILGIQRIVLAAFAPVAPVWRGHFQHRDFSVLQVAQQACAIRSGTLHTDAEQFTK